MDKFYGTKLLQAKPMNREAYNRVRGWEVPADENPEDEGYLVEYLDGGKPNVEGYDGYVSWSPKEQFDKAYQPLTALSFGHATEVLKAKGNVARAGWNGKGMFLFLEDGVPGYWPFIAINTGSEVRPWLASQADMLADDWQVVE